ncbi:hypothetical protein TVAG_204730 [Trichomonas vaginalis G3]|uniref:Uncharacterized protein n=1 Tax=Trichomonas vaginalis (strain ATCC PRA-98 / G3) TaxID=412133 RepID=A2EIX7_TRIV3|nr:hypothetical protein TVAGG3_0661450 [Trichomonas vaginalis G3]EAY07367.1 hypothetical protein TVAG_204730 [Trichomonas vaginalis G3]KAI5506520.1 hypothetical protein TVAGG3_0661450 [Trichomonas vaginalis G3]|eukprot:XP_001319590.1 hypothetical protein [Trichomonas vaginalis G3]
MKELSHDYIDNGIDFALKQFGFLSKIFNFFGINGYVRSVLNLKQLEYKKLTEINTKINDVALSNHELLHGVFNQFFIDAISRAILLVGVKQTYLMQAVNSEINDFNVRMVKKDVLKDTIICKVSNQLNENKQIKIGLRHRTPILIISNYLKNYNDNERALQKILCNGNIAAIFIIENSRNISTNYFCIANDVIFVFDRKMTLAAKIPISQIKSLLENTLTLFTSKEPIVFSNELSQAVKLFISTKTDLAEN